MANALITGVSGLNSHQKMLEVIGNNLANINTTAYKTARTLFTDLMYEGQRGASSGTSGVLGSINPLQVGTGSKVANVDLNFRQGNLEATGEQLDAAIDGNGFFVATSGNARVFTRNGAFSLDEDGYLEDSATGFLIQRFGTVGELPELGPAFQTPGDDRIRVPIGASIPGRVTTEIGFSGQLGADATGPTSRLIRGFTLTSGGLNATPATLLNDLDSIVTPYVPGDELLLTGQQANGTQIASTLSVDNTTTVQDLMDHITTLFPEATVSFVSGAIEIQANDTGPSAIHLAIEDEASNTGFSNAEFSANFDDLEPGRNATVVVGSLPIYDERGAEHTLNYRLTKQIDESWMLNFELDGTSGSIIDSQVSGIRFASDGSLSQITGTGDGDPNISVIFKDSTIAQTIQIRLGTLGEVDGLAEIGTGPEISFVTDGSSPGELATVQIDADGTLSGIASNGIKFALAQLAIASFRNPDGLNLSGSGYYEESLASGTAEIGTPLSGDRGAIRSGQLEGSNVDLALEFTRL
ncbi:MAG: flagellar hook-basal body complex protein, partial [Planctomycetaceae bacterium]|nr:flagellar hook-basal body complex protein [Planctomycetaceae bacterium]